MPRRRSSTFRLKRDGGLGGINPEEDPKSGGFSWRLKRLGHFNIGWKNGYFYRLRKIGGHRRYYWPMRNFIVWKGTEIPAKAYYELFYPIKFF